MERIICDTNIWYDIANQKIDTNLIKSHKLIATSVNVQELASTPYLTEDINLLARTISALKKNHYSVYKANPFEHIISIFHSNFKPNHDINNRLLHEFDIFLSMDIQKISDANLKNTKKDLKKHFRDQMSVVDPINLALPKIKLKVKQQGGKNIRKKINTTESWKGFISKMVSVYSKQYLDREYTLDLKNPLWEQLKFFLLTFDKYFLMLEIEHDRKFDKNDWGDLLNLVYVQPGSKYWTSEKKWNNLFKSDKTLSNYIFDYNSLKLT